MDKFKQFAIFAQRYPQKIPSQVQATSTASVPTSSGTKKKRKTKQKKAYVNCGICKVNGHDKRHFNSVEHRDRIKYLLDKESIKINLVKEALENKCPLIDTRSLHEQSNFEAFCWCRFCDVEARVSVPPYPKLVTFGDEKYTQHEVISSNKYLAYAFHLCSKNHKKSVKTFWTTYELNAGDMMSYLFTKRQKNELEDKLLILAGLIEKDSISSSMNSLHCERVQPQPKAPLDVAPVASIKRMQSSLVSGEGLTRIEVPKLAEGEGNVFSGGIPPWMRNRNTTTIIGPSLPPPDYVPPAKQKVVNPNKIGGLFDRTKAKRAGEDFLPSFSGVWHEANKSRYQSKEEFQKQQKRQKIEKTS